MEVVLFDNFSRRGVEQNVARLSRNYAERNLKTVKGDVRDASAVQKHTMDASVVYHTAAQVAVTMSLADPRLDFDVNALGTLNVLEAARKSNSNPMVFFTSTNKVYGSLDGVDVKEHEKRYAFKKLKKGVDEGFPLDPTTPYGLSKCIGDMYCRDYYRVYGLPTVVFRMSCIYGPGQRGNEDQGWLAHFAISALKRQPISIYGTGKQVRDVLYIDDLLTAIDLAFKKIHTAKGQAYNIGGGPKNTVSVLEAIEFLERRLNCKIPVKFSDWRLGDQKVYVSNVQKAMRDFGWQPKVSVEQGLDRLLQWCHSLTEGAKTP